MEEKREGREKGREEEKRKEESSREGSGGAGQSWWSRWKTERHHPGTRVSPRTLTQRGDVACVCVFAVI